MEEQAQFLEILEEIKKIAVTQGNFIRKQEITQFLGDMQLDSSQMDAVYHYLGASGIVVEGYRYTPDLVTRPQDGSDLVQSSQEGALRRGRMPSRSERQIGTAKTKAAKSSHVKKKSGKDGSNADKDRAEINRRLYQRELNSIRPIEGDEICELVAAFLKGDEQARQNFIESRLSLVMKISAKYRKMDVVKTGVVLSEEIVAEGNMGLLLGIEEIQSDSQRFFQEDGKPDLVGIDEILRIEIVRAIETMIDSQTSDRDWENAVLARTNLLHEAAKYMTSEMGRVPLKEELSEYTKIPVEEIERIMGLSEDAKRISDTGDQGDDSRK